MGTSFLARSFESLAHQTDNRLFGEVVEAFTFLREYGDPLNGGKNTETAVRESGIDRIVLKRTGIKATLSTGTQHGINAFIYPPILDRNHPLSNTMHRTVSDNSEAEKRLKKAKNGIAGEIDLNKGRVSGVYSDVECPVFVATQIIQEDRFTIEEAAAIFLHEIGHAFTFLEYLGRTFTLNHVLGDLNLAYAGAESHKKRVEIIEVVSDALDIHDVDAREVAEHANGKLIQQWVVSEVVNKPHSATDTPFYDYRTSEALADQFVSRLGGGRHLATGLDRLFRLSGADDYRNNARFVIIQIIMGAVMVTFPIVTALLVILAGSFYEGDMYDPPVERIKRIRRDMVDALKSPKMSRERRQQLQSEIDELSKLTEGVKDKKGLLMFMIENVNPKNWKRQSRLKYFQDLENLANNELYVKANELTLKA